MVHNKIISEFFAFFESYIFPSARGRSKNYENYRSLSISSGNDPTTHAMIIIFGTDV